MRRQEHSAAKKMTRLDKMQEKENSKFTYKPYVNHKNLNKTFSTESNVIITTRSAELRRTRSKDRLIELDLQVQ